MTGACCPPNLIHAGAARACSWPCCCGTPPDPSHLPCRDTLCTPRFIILHDAPGYVEQGRSTIPSQTTGRARDNAARCGMPAISAEIATAGLPARFNSAAVSSITIPDLGDYPRNPFAVPPPTTSPVPSATDAPTTSGDMSTAAPSNIGAYSDASAAPALYQPAPQHEHNAQHTQQHRRDGQDPLPPPRPPLGHERQRDETREHLQHEPLV